LPAGLRDLLPHEADEQARASGSVMECFELFGYQRVSVPAFELASVMEKWVGAEEANAMLRFVDPESGEVVALRPDMTPQVARLVATRLRSAPSPVRLCYQGSVLRRRHERARRRRQIQQLGFELIGVDAALGDMEVLQTATAGVRAAGLIDFTLDIGHAAIATALLEGANPAARSGLVEALAVKDSAKVAQAASGSGLPAATQKALIELPELHGGDDIWPRALALLAGTKAQAPAAMLQQIWTWARRNNIATNLMVDLGELRKLDYYTGVTFQILAHGPGEAVGSGGRYDLMFEQFGAARPAAGFAIDLGNLCWAVNESGKRAGARKRVLLIADAHATHDELAGRLREAGVVCARATATMAAEYGRAWGYDALLQIDEQGTRLQVLEDDRVFTADATQAAAVVTWVLKALQAPGNG